VAASNERVRPSWLIEALNSIEDVIYVAVAAILVAIAAVLLYRTVVDSFSGHHLFADRITTAVNGVLFVVIVLELFRTVIAHLEGGGFQLIPFLVIGIISSVRHILLIGSRSLSAETGNVFNHTQIELAVNAGVALALVIALVLVRRSEVDGASDLS
jgi:uncharacterized membrane protein (DUF373 family)